MSRPRIDNDADRQEDELLSDSDREGGAEGEESDVSITSSDSDTDDENKGPLEIKDVSHPDFVIKCPTCAIYHPKPTLCDLYRTCHFCTRIHRWPADLQVTHHVKAAGALHILAASYGHPDDAARAVDIAGKLQEHVNDLPFTGSLRGCRLLLLDDDFLIDLFGDPCPGMCKRIRIRYSILERRAELFADEIEPGYLKENIDVLATVTTTPRLKIVTATYGHRAGVVRNKGEFNIAEALQARCDKYSGDFMELTHDEELEALFGDPCPGFSKVASPTVPTLPNTH
jgi:hypothetical protein